MKRIIFILLCVCFLYGCASSTFTSKPEGAQIHVGKTEVSGIAPVEGRVPRTSFGKYPIKIKKDGYETLYGMLPMNVSGGAIVADILIFAPLTFFNVQGSFSYYEFDLEKRVIRYRDNVEDNWLEYTIRDAQREYAKQFFGD